METKLSPETYLRAADRFDDFVKSYVELRPWFDSRGLPPETFVKILSLILELTIILREEAGNAG